MTQFNSRSTRTELLDEKDIPKQDLYRNLFELNIINHFLGGHAVTLKGLKKFKLVKQQEYTILDIGSGGGDTLKAIAIWGRKNGFTLKLIGVDLKSDCIDYAQAFCKDYQEISFIQSDYRDLDKLEFKADIIVTSLFCHHLSNNELKHLFKWCNTNAKIGFLMNDLHRHPLAYYSIAFLTSLFSKSYLVKNDAKLSVLRGFKKNDLMDVLHELKVNSFSLKWKWAFRWLLIIEK